MKVKTTNDRILTFKLGTLFDCSIYEPEWFPKPRADVFAVFCGPTIKEAFKNQSGKQTPKVGDYIFVDFQQGGPGGGVRCMGQIAEILGEEEPPADWGTTGFKDMGVKVVGEAKKLED